MSNTLPEVALSPGQMTEWLARWGSRKPLDVSFLNIPHEESLKLRVTYMETYSALKEMYERTQQSRGED